MEHPQGPTDDILLDKTTLETPTLSITFRGSLLDYLRFQIRHSIPLPLSEGEITLIAYLHLYKEKASEKYRQDGHSKSEKSVDNYISKFRKDGLVFGNLLNPQLYLSSSPNDHIYNFEVI